MLSLNKHDRIEVKRRMKQGKSAREINRSYVLNLSDKGMSEIEVADCTELTPRTVRNICQTYVGFGLERALEDDPRPGRPPKYDDRIKAKIVATVCSDPVEGFDRWTLELLKEQVEKEKIVDSICKESLRLILIEHDLKPWQQEMWCVPELNEEFIERMEDVLDVYEKPYNKARPVVCVDEKPVVLHGEVKDPIPMEKGKPKRVDYEYTRNGAANVFCAVEPKAGTYINRATEKRTGREFAKFLAAVERKYSEVEKIVLVMDNLSTHKEKSLTDFYGEKDGKTLWNRFEVHYTPKHGSWLNQAEIAIGMYQRQCIAESRTPDIPTLRKRTNAWNKIINRKKVTINWRFSKLDARQKFEYG